MDHNEAIQQNVAVKYVLGELSQPERDAYEEHYFDCSLCAVDIKALATFADTTREVLRLERDRKLAEDPVPARSAWMRWLQPIVAVPAMAALLLIIAYQNTVTIPQAKEAGSSGISQVLFSSHQLRGVNTAGENARTLAIRANESFFLNFDFVPTKNFDNYIGQIEDANGRVVLRTKIAGANANQEAHLPVGAGVLHAGKYVLAFYGDPGDTGKANPQNDAGRLAFTVEIQP